MAAVPRIVLTGGEGTGKTTLAAALAAAMGTRWVPEFARGYAERVGRPLTADDIAPIAEGQHASEVAAEAAWRAHGSGAAPPPLVLDTDLVSTVVYARHYHGAVPATLQARARARVSGLYLLCAPDLPWEADPVRGHPRDGPRLHAAFGAQLAAWGATVVPVTGGGAARLAAALEAVRAWARRP